MRFSNGENLEEWGEVINFEYVISWGFLDLVYRIFDEIWVFGGSGNLLCSNDGG